MTRPSTRTSGVLLGVLPVSDSAKAELARRMDAPSRHYHTMKHLDLVWSRHLRFKAAANLCERSTEMLVALAIAYHDSVYTGGATDNEERSAVFWMKVSAETRLDEADRLWVADTIRATASHIEAARAIDQSDPRGRARQWVLDLDLTPLGERPDVFDENMKLLASELSHLSAPQRRASLLAALRHFSEAKPLYRCPAIAAAFESQARDNFRRILGNADVSA